MSPYDIAIITKEALKYPVVLEYMNSTRTTLHTSERSPNIANYGREELYDDPYAIGSKSGLSALGKYTVVTVDEKTVNVSLMLYYLLPASNCILIRRKWHIMHFSN